MRLKIKNIPQFENAVGLTDANCVFSVSDVIFRYKQASITIVWEVTTSAGKSFTVDQAITFNPSDAGQVSLIEANSDAIHAIAMDAPFLPTPTGLKSFTDMSAQTIEINV